MLSIKLWVFSLYLKDVEYPPQLVVVFAVHGYVGGGRLVVGVLTVGTDVTVHVVGLSLTHPDTPTVEPVLALVTPDVEPTGQRGNNYLP